MAAVLALEREFAAGHQDEPSFRKKMEEMTVGSLFAAVRGVDRRSGSRWMSRRVWNAGNS